MISPSSFGIHQIPIRDRSRSFRYDVAFWFCCVVLFSVGPGVSIIIIVYWRKVSQENGAILVDFPLNMLLFLASVATSMGAVVSCMLFVRRDL
jgi:hypothetical protein